MTPTETACRLPVGDDDYCGDPAVAIDVRTDQPRCAEHVDEELWRLGNGWIPEPTGPIAWLPAVAA